MHLRGHVIWDSQTWGRLCAILMGTIAATIVLIAVNRTSVSTRSKQLAGVFQGQLHLASDDSSKEAGYAQHLAQLAQEVNLLDVKLHAARLQRRQHGESNDGGSKAQVQQTHGLGRGELLHVIAADNSSTALVEAGRLLRKGLQAAVVVDGDVSPEMVYNGSHAKETWVNYSSELSQQPLSEHTKWALAPFLAHQAVGFTGYKWMLFGNASTVFFPEAALQLLEDFDEELPYIITDDLLWSNASGAAVPDEAPRCLPCHFDDAGELLRVSHSTLMVQEGDANSDSWHQGLPKGCPCTPKLVCQARPQFSANSNGCSNPDYPLQQAYSMSGSSGVIVSAALLHSIDLQEVTACIQSVLWPDADGPKMLLECLWHFGYAVTDPGIAAYRPSVRLFDPMKGAETYEIANRLKWDVAPEDTCDLQCQDLVHFMVSAYVKGGDTEAAAASIKKLASMWMWWWEAQKPDFAPTTLYWTFD